MQRPLPGKLSKAVDPARRSHLTSENSLTSSSVQLEPLPRASTTLQLPRFFDAVHHGSPWICLKNSTPIMFGGFTLCWILSPESSSRTERSAYFIHPPLQ